MKILILKFGDPILDYVQSSLQSLKHETMGLDMKAASLKELKQNVEKFKPQFCLINNLDVFVGLSFGEELETYFLERSLPVVSWFFASPRTSIKPPRGVFILASDSYDVSYFKERGVDSAHLPMGVNPELERWTASSAFKDHAISYVGSSFFKFAGDPPDFRQEGATREYYVSHLETEFKQRLQTQSSAPVSALHRGMFERYLSEYVQDPMAYEQWRNKLVEALRKTLPSEHHEALNLFYSRFDIVYSFYWLTDFLKRLVSKGLRIYGSETWAPFFPHYEHKIRSLSQEELFQCFSGSRVTFCMTKSVFHHYVHDRVLAVIAVGGFPLTDYRADLDILFEKGEVATYRTFEEAAEVVDYYSKHDNERNKLVEKARQRVLKTHTYFHRTQTLLDQVKKKFKF